MCAATCWHSTMSTHPGFFQITFGCATLFACPRPMERCMPDSGHNEPHGDHRRDGEGQADESRETLVLRVTPEGEPHEHVAQAAELLRTGKLVAFPTET